MRIRRSLAPAAFCFKALLACVLTSACGFGKEDFEAVLEAIASAGQLDGLSR
jgi:hypothetical protein